MTTKMIVVFDVEYDKKLTPRVIQENMPDYLAWMLKKDCKEGDEYVIKNPVVYQRLEDLNHDVKNGFIKV